MFQDKLTFRLKTWSGRDDGPVTWDPSRRELRGAGVGAELLRREMEKAHRAGRLSTPAGPIAVADPYADPGGLADCVGQHWRIPRELEPFMVRREGPEEAEGGLPVVY